MTRQMKRLIEELEQAETIHQELKYRIENTEGEKIDLGFGLQTKEEARIGLQNHQIYIETLKAKIEALNK